LALYNLRNAADVKYTVKLSFIAPFLLPTRREIAVLPSLDHQLQNVDGGEDVLVVLSFFLTFLLFIHHHLPPWISSFDLFWHRRIAIVSWGVHDILFPEVCS